MLFFDFFARLEDLVEVAAHIADARDAIGDEERQGDVFPRFSPIVKKSVDVHVPEPGNHEFSRRVNHLSVFGDFHVALCADSLDAVARNYDGHFRLHAPSGRVNHRCVHEDETDAGTLG